MARTPRRWAGPILFGLALAALAALTAHWLTLLWRHESGSVSDQERRLVSRAHDVANRLGRTTTPPSIGAVPGEPGLEVVTLSPLRSPEGVVRLYPHWRRMGVRPLPEVVASLRERRERRTLMLVGEGALGLLLLGVCVLMLWRMLRGERQRRREIEAFINTVSHELKTPLAGIKALLGTIQMGYIPRERLAEFIEMGLRESDRLEHLVENLLIANRIHRSALDVHISAVDLEVFLAELLKHRRALLPEDHAGIRFDPGQARGVWVRADADKLRVVLENLMDNALKYGDSSEIWLEVRSTGSGVAISVRDQGVGFAPDQAEAIFQGLRANIGAGGALVHGTGLGLGIARDLTLAMGGRLTASSEGPGRGSRFTVLLPEVSAGSTGGATGSTEGAATGSTEETTGSKEASAGGPAGGSAGAGPGPAAGGSSPGAERVS